MKVDVFFLMQKNPTLVVKIFVVVVSLFILPQEESGLGIKILIFSPVLWYWYMLFYKDRGVSWAYY